MNSYGGRLCISNFFFFFFLITFLKNKDRTQVSITYLQCGPYRLVDHTFDKENLKKIEC